MQAKLKKLSDPLTKSINYTNNYSIEFDFKDCKWKMFADVDIDGDGPYLSSIKV